MNRHEQRMRTGAASAQAEPHSLPGEEAVSNDDLMHGQIVIVTARWILVLSALLIALWSPGRIGELRLEIVVSILLAAANFYLHAQLLMRKQTVDERIVYGASLGDLAVITAIVAAQGGFASGNFIFYYPAVLAFSVVFPRKINVFYTGGAALIYGALAVATSDLSQQALSLVFSRVLMLAAVGVCGNLYWRIERDRRQSAARAQAALVRPA